MAHGIMMMLVMLAMVKAICWSSPRVAVGPRYEYLLNTTPNFTGGFKQLRAESVDTELPYVTPDIEQLGLQDAIPVITPFICLTIDSRVVKPACLGPVFTRKQAVPMCS